MFVPLYCSVAVTAGFNGIVPLVKVMKFVINTVLFDGMVNGNWNTGACVNVVDTFPAETIAGWIEDYRSDEDAVRADLDWAAVLTTTRRQIDRWNELGTEICRRFLDHVAASTTATPRA